jgi:hypothetical protein
MRPDPALVHTAPLCGIFTRRATGGSATDLHVAFGQATFDAEGSEAPGRYFSRSLHWPGGRSGVTIGRGYDMGHRTRLQVERELAYAGVDHQDALELSAAAGLRGEQAERFVLENKQFAPIISTAAQLRLFEGVTTVEVLSDIRRIFSKPDVVARYGRAEWATLPRPIQELVFDLRYRGDYTPAVRERIQPHIVRHDVDGLRKAMSDVSYWGSLGVPQDRIIRRIGLLRESERHACAA